MNRLLLLRNSVMVAGFCFLASTIRNETDSVFVVLVTVIMELPMLMLIFLVLSSRESFKKKFASSLGTLVMTLPFLLLFLTMSAEIMKDVNRDEQIKPFQLLIFENKDSILVLIPFLVLGYVLDGTAFVRSGKRAAQLEMHVFYQFLRIFGIIIAGLVAATFFQKDVAWFEQKDVWIVAYSILTARLFFEYFVYKRLTRNSGTEVIENEE